MATQLPVVVGLTVCRDFLRDPNSGNVSVIRSFSGYPVDSFPGKGEPFRVFGILADGIGAIRVELVVTWFGDEGIVEYARLRGRVPFHDPLRVVECVFRFDNFTFPGPGLYLFTMLIDDEWAAQRSIRVYQREGTTP